MRQVNLLPDEIKRTSNINLIRNSCIVVCIPIIALIVIIHILLVAQVSRLNQIAAQPPTPIDTPAIKQLRENLVSFRQELAFFKEKNEIIVEHILGDIATDKLFSVIAAATSDKVWLEQFHLDMLASKCVLEGRSFNTRLVSEFILELKKIPYFFEVDLISMEKSKAAQGDEISFRIECVLR